MRRQQLTTISAVALLFFSVSFLTLFPEAAFAQYSSIYRNYRELGFEALEQGHYQKALLFFQTAQSVEPADEELVQYINLVKRLIENRIEGAPAVKDQTVQLANDETEAPKPRALTKAATARTSQPLKVQPQTVSHKIEVLVSEDQNADMTKGTTDDLDVPFDKGATAPQNRIVQAPERAPLISSRTRSQPLPSADVKLLDPAMADDDYPVELLELSDSLWAEQPNTLIELPLDTKLLIRSDNRINRVLVTTPEMIDMVQTNRSEIAISPLMRSQTFLHIWEDSGRRWTFTLKTTLPLKVIEEGKRYEPKRQGSVENFKMTYDTNWYSTYSGPSKDKLDRDSLNFVNTFGLYGPTPYGNLDGIVTLYKTDLTPTETTYYTVGVSQGKVGVLDDFHLRLFDSARPFSNLTFPGRQIRGILFEDKVYYDELTYTYLRGQSRSTYGTPSPNVSNQNESYVEGLRVKYKPSDDFGLALNYARAWGTDTSPFAKDRAVSIETENKLTENFAVYSEFAYDEDEMAQRARLNYTEDSSNLEARLRNIPSAYANVSGAPSGQGEVGSDFTYRRNFEKFDLSSYIDFYRDHQNENPENPDAVNIDFNSNIYVPLTDRSSWRTDLYYFHSPGLLSDDTDTRVSSTYSKIFSLWSRNLSTYITETTQFRRSDSNLDSEYDRNSMTVGAQYSLTNDLSVSASYEQYWIKDRGTTPNTIYPEVFYTALNYRKMLSDQWRWNAGLSYRNEERSENEKSFLAGEDSLTSNLGLTFSPNPDVNIYVDGRLRDVWAENSRNTAYTEADVNFGMRSAWDLGLAWNPSALVEGHVFKDINSNGRRDEGEPGIPGVSVLIGETSSVTDPEGWYYAEIKARSVVIGLDVETVPDGYVFQNQLQQEFEITHKDVIRYDIALATRSGIYGIVFVDSNGNKSPDADEEKIGNVKVILDGELSTVSDMRGSYFFNNIEQGQHTITIDINSVPMQYLPSIALEHTITIVEGTTYMFHVPVYLKQ